MQSIVVVRRGLASQALEHSHHPLTCHGQSDAQIPRIWVPDAPDGTYQRQTPRMEDPKSALTGNGSFDCIGSSAWPQNLSN